MIRKRKLLMEICEKIGYEIYDYVNKDSSIEEIEAVHKKIFEKSIIFKFSNAFVANIVILLKMFEENNRSRKKCSFVKEGLIKLLFFSKI